MADYYGSDYIINDPNLLQQVMNSSTQTQQTPSQAPAPQYKYSDWQSVQSGDVNRAWTDWSAMTGSQDPNQFKAETGLTYTPPSTQPAQTNYQTGNVAQPMNAATPSGSQPASWMPPDWQNWNTEERWTNLIKNVGQSTNPNLNAYSYAGGAQDLVNQYNKLYGANAKFLGGPSGDMVDFGDGRGPVDIKLANGSFWFGSPYSPGPGPASAGTPGTPGAGGTAPTAPGTVPTPTASGSYSQFPGTATPAADDPLRQQLVDSLMQRATQSLDVSNDPAIRQQADAYAANQERQKRSYLQQLAESAGPNANITAQERLASEQAGQASGSFEAGLMGQEIAARRQEIQSALASEQGLLTSDQQLALTRELAQLDDATRRLGITTQAGTAAAGQDLAWQQALLNNQQFLDTLGLQGENQANYWDAVRSGLIGG